MTKSSILKLAFLLCLIAPTTNISSQIPPPIDLGIQNLRQQNQMWCWAAAAQQVIFWINGSSPQQCELVAAANGVLSDDCCSDNQSCSVPGGFEQIQTLILQYGGHYSGIAPPANPTVIYNTLSQGKAIILFLRRNQLIGHYVVLRGMAWVTSPYGVQPVFYINDPMAIYTQPVYFADLVSIWAGAIVVY